MRFCTQYIVRLNLRVHTLTSSGGQHCCIQRTRGEPNCGHAAWTTLPDFLVRTCCLMAHIPTVWLHGPLVRVFPRDHYPSFHQLTDTVIITTCCTCSPGLACSHAQSTFKACLAVHLGIFSVLLNLATLCLAYLIAYQKLDSVPRAYRNHVHYCAM